MAAVDEMGDLYELLGVSRSASDDEIKKAYRKKAREFHPDTNSGDPQMEERFKEVSFAYEVLRDPERRSRYDRFGPSSFGAGSTGSGPFGFTGGLGDLFEAFFGSMAGGGRGGHHAPFGGQDAEVVVEITFPESVFGTQSEVAVRLPVLCSTCEGSGAKTGTEPVVCPDCQGTGEIRRIRQSILGQVVTAVSCARCQGFGRFITDPCLGCGGEGRQMEDCKYTVDVPAGVDDGSTLRLAGRGPAGPRGGPNGSLYVHLSVASDPRIERHGDDLHSTVHVGMAQAALGAELSVDTLDDTRLVLVAPGTQSGHVARLKGLGVPHLRGRGRGDFYFHLVVDTPTALSESQSALLRQLAGERGEALADPANFHEGVLSKIRSALT